MMINKKAFTIQFSWIFVLIVGFLIMIFVISVIGQQRDVSDEDIDVEISKNMESILTSSEQSVNTFKIIEIPKSNIRRVCEDNYSAYWVNNKPQRIENSIFFMPKYIKNTEVYTWSQTYDVPMKIANILYMTDSKHLYIFVNDTTEDIEKIYANFPKNMTIDIVNQSDLSNYEDRNYDDYTIIAVNHSNNIDKDHFPVDLPEESNALLINYESGKRKGKIKFYKYNSSDEWEKEGSKIFIDESMLYGAIFAGDLEGYECNEQKLLDKSKNIYRIYNYTTMQLNASESKSDCVSSSGHYARALDYLESLISYTDANNWERIYSESSELADTNDDLAVDACPQIY